MTIDKILVKLSPVLCLNPMGKKNQLFSKGTAGCANLGGQNFNIAQLKSGRVFILSGLGGRLLREKFAILFSFQKQAKEVE